MANGYSVEDMLERIERQLESVEKKIDTMNRELSSINANGCAHRPDDIARMDRLESWRDRTVAGIISLAIAVIINFFRGVR